MSVQPQQSPKQEAPRPPPSTAGKRVTELRTNAVVQVGPLAVTSLMPEKHNVDMELHPIGVLVAFRSSKRTILIPFANISFVALEE